MDADFKVDRIGLKDKFAPFNPLDKKLINSREKRKLGGHS